MNEIINSLKDYFNKIGVKISLIVTSISFLLLTVALIGINFEMEQLETFCFLSIFLEFIYGVTLTFKIMKNREKYNHLIPFLILNWFIGCFCTNVFINIFENLPIWVYVATFTFCFTNFLIYSNFKHKILTPISYFINGFTYLLIVYYTLYLLPFLPISFIGILAIGMGFYGLVPVIVLLIHTTTLVKILANNKLNRSYFLTGITSIFVGMVLFVSLLNHESKKIGENSITKSFENNDDLPAYIKVSQNLKPNFFNEILLKKDIVYICSDDIFEFRGLNSFGNKQYNERKTHNPLINIGLLFSKDLNLSVDDRINILKSNFDKRLETEEQLWSGDDLFTKNIKEDIKIYTDERLAYTEITMDIACDKNSWGQKEAIYSFQLPEGSVATSLSLWVNGIERKGVLTTKEKAAKAYKQIVGVEARDPSLMQWKEGNKVVVRVFPISYELPRTFKCGFTTPLKVENNQLKYRSLNIKGPNINNAATISRVQMVGNSKFESDKKFELKNNFYINESNGLAEWEATMSHNNQLISKSFLWKDKSYTVNEIERETTSLDASEIVLDLNSSWTLKEIETILNNDKNNYYTYFNNQKAAINLSNYKEIQSQFENLHYSLLPLYKLPENCLVVTKCESFSANFEELETSDYLKKIKAGTKLKHIKVLNISEEINPFWQTIKEQHYVEYSKTDLKTCIKLIADNEFISLKSSENTINIEPSNISIHENPSEKTFVNNGSNHIYRMYAFGKVLEEQVKIQEDSLANNRYITLAKDANIVTPISSLIVLETDEDYEKNGIEKNVNTLGNASINNDGAVPEPHEWAMIIIAFILISIYYKKSKKQVA